MKDGFTEERVKEAAVAKKVAESLQDTAAIDAVRNLSKGNWPGHEWEKHLEILKKIAVDDEKEAIDEANVGYSLKRG